MRITGKKYERSRIREIKNDMSYIEVVEAAGGAGKRLKIMNIVGMMRS